MLKLLLNNESGEASGGARLLVVLYAAAIVALGWHPLNKGKGSIFDSLSKAASQVADSFSRPRTRSAKPNAKLKVEIPAKQLNKPSVDKLTEDDREELNSLIDNL
jgi:hypothetical protein